MAPGSSGFRVVDESRFDLFRQVRQRQVRIGIGQDELEDDRREAGADAVTRDVEHPRGQHTFVGSPSEQIAGKMAVRLEHGHRLDGRVRRHLTGEEVVLHDVAEVECGVHPRKEVGAVEEVHRAFRAPPEFGRVAGNTELDDLGRRGLADDLLETVAEGSIAKRPVEIEGSAEVVEKGSDGGLGCRQLSSDRG